MATATALAIPTKSKPKLLTAADLLALYSNGIRGELIRGIISETTPATGEHGEIVVYLGWALQTFIKPRRLGRITGSDSGILLERSPDTVREPDIAFFSADKIPPGVRIRGYYQVPPDLAVEIASPTDSAAAINDKALMWLRYGARLAWTLHPDQRRLDIHTPDGAVQSLTDGDTLTGGDILPGFTCPISDIFDAT